MMDEILNALNNNAAGMRIAGLTEIYRMGELAGAYGMGNAVVPLLQDSVISVQVQALFALGAMGEAAVPFGASVVAKLSSTQKEVKRAAIQALGGMGEAGGEFIADLEPLLDDSDLDYVADSCAALGNLKATGAVNKIVAKLKDKDVDVVCGAVSGLGSMGMELAAIGGMLSHTEPRVRAAALATLYKMDGSEQFAAEAVKLLGDTDGWVRNQAAVLVSTMDGKAGVQAAAIGKFLSHDDAGVKAAAAFALTGLGDESTSQVGALEKMLSETGEDTSTVPLVKAGVASKVDSNLRKPACAAAYALGCMGAQAAKSAPMLAEGLKADDDEMKIACAAALGKMGPEGTKFEGAICALLDYNMPMVVIAALESLTSTGLSGVPSSNGADKAAVLLADRHPCVRKAAAECLAAQGDYASAYIEDIVQSLSDPVHSVKAAGIKAVASSGEMGQMYASKVCQLMFDASQDVRIAACEALASMDQRGAAFAEEVSSLLEDDVPEVRSAAVKALSSFKHGSEFLPEALSN